VADLEGDGTVALAPEKLFQCFPAKSNKKRVRATLDDPQKVIVHPLERVLSMFEVVELQI
jgi:hypothetical protein